MNSRAILFGIILVATVMAPAAADPRGDLLNAMNKCVAIADDKARLACYDALKPQLQAALAEPAAQVAKEEGTSWFGLDHIFGSSNETPQTEPKQFGADRLPPEEQAKVNPPPPQVAAAKELDSITATLTDYALTPTGRFIVFLDNGQVWQEIEGDTATAHFKKNPKENIVTISRAFLGSYALTLNDLNQSYKVKRMK
ncbi:MAG TPA: hypothetical protein VGG10_04545 [Rhizomicrobium sp.]|jgi:hypothetical protein